MPAIRFTALPCLLAATLLCGTEARAQKAADASAPDAARVAAAHRVLEASGTVDAMLAAIRANLPAQRAASPQLPAEFWTRFEARVVQDAPQLVDTIAVLYARMFTLQELDALSTFYASPVGLRFRAMQPTLVTESSAIGQRWGMRIGSEIGASLSPR
jgi:uncharacterized protein